LIAQITQVIPEPVLKEHLHKEIVKPNSLGLLSCLSTVLLQEMQKYEKLINRITTSLWKLQRAVDGQELMSTTFENMMISMLNNEVPKNWKEVAYPSLKPLGSWIEDLGQRLNFIRTWAT
jgi:dynein heavy chain